MLSAACLAAPSPRRFSPKPRTLRPRSKVRPIAARVLKDVLECYFDTTIQTKREVRDQIDACILRVTNEATAAVQSRLCPAGGWMSCPIGAEKDTG